MTEQKIARKISSYAAPTEDDLAYFESLPEGERRALLRAEIEKGIASGLSHRTFQEIVADARAKLADRRDNDG
jgi:hypothetical protein